MSDELSTYNAQAGAVNPNGGDPRKFLGSIASGVTPTAVVIATSGTIATAKYGVSRVAPAAAVTGVILQAGLVDGQRVTVLNESIAASSVTFAAAGTSNVADGVGTVIAGVTSRSYVWDATTSRWYVGG